MVIIALTGLARSGKSTAATFLQDHAGAERVRFADPLKSMLRSLGLGDEEIEGGRKEAPCPLLCGQTPRAAMITLGTEWGRGHVGRDLWVRAWLLNILHLCGAGDRALSWLALRDRPGNGDLLRELVAVEGGPCVVAEDCRFPNEAAVVRELGGVVVRIDNPRVKPRARWGWLGRLLLRAGLWWAVHPSERVDRLAADFVIVNDGTIEELEEKLLGLTKRLGVQQVA